VIKRARNRLTYANVVSTLCLFILLGGGAYAATKLAKDSVTSKQIKAGAVKGAELRNNAVTGKKVANGSLLGEDFAAGQLPRGPRGEKGDACLPGNPACIGPPGAAAVSEFAEFFALMPADNASTVAVGAAVDFPQDGPTSGDITRASADTFLLAEVGTYRVDFSVSVSEAGQLGLSLNGTELDYTIFGRATGTSPIAGEALVTTTTPNSTISVVNPTGNSTALTITPLAGGTRPVAASLVIQQLR
jgi:hypothetical protein